MRKKVLFWIHVLTIFVFILSPFLFNWKIILLGIFLYYIQIFFLGNCILTTLQFGKKKKDKSFYHYLLTKIGINLNENKVNFFIIYIKPWILFLFALVLQIILKFSPLLI